VKAVVVLDSERRIVDAYRRRGEKL